MHPTVRAVINPAEDKKEKNVRNIRLVDPPRPPVRIKAKVKLGVKNLKNNISINILLWKILI
jgi:hypothetical protein